MEYPSPNLFTDLFASKIGKIDAAFEAVGGLSTGHDGVEFILEAIGDHLCQVILNTDGKDREWNVMVSTRTIDGWQPSMSCYAIFAGGKIVSLRD